MALLLIKLLHDRKAVLRVNPEQLEQYEPDGPAFVGGLGFDLAPEVIGHVAERVVSHGVFSCPTKLGSDDRVVITAPSRDDLGYQQRAA